MNGTKHLEARIAGRNAAKELFPLLEWPDGHGADFADGLLKALAELLPKRKADIVEPEKPIPIARLGATNIPFGKWINYTFDETPIEYLDWLCSSQESFYKDLRAYLKHPELESRRRGI